MRDTHETDLGEPAKTRCSHWVFFVSDDGKNIFFDVGVIKDMTSKGMYRRACMHTHEYFSNRSVGHNGEDARS